MQFARNAHHIYYLHYHFVWIPKYRHKVFEEPHRSYLKYLIRKIAYDYNYEVIELEVPPDHIHLILAAPPRESPASIMQKIKSITAREFFRKYPLIKAKYFWGGHLWTESYYVETVGRKNEDELRRYVRDQLKVMDEQEQQLRLFEPDAGARKG